MAFSHELLTDGDAPPDRRGTVRRRRSGPARRRESACQTGPVSAPDPSTRAGFPSALAALGPFFAVDRHPDGASSTEPWRPISDLAEPGGALLPRIERVRTALAASGGRSPDQVERRVAVSVAHLGLVARLIAPAVGAAALGCPLPLDAASWWWQDELGGPFPVSVGDRSGALRVPGSAVEAITLACLRADGVSPRVLWGNVASAANSAASMIGRTRPDLAEATRSAADAFLADERVEDGALRVGPGFRRRSCCLIYRLTGSTTAVCGDCVLGAG